MSKHWSSFVQLSCHVWYHCPTFLSISVNTTLRLDTCCWPGNREMGSDNDPSRMLCPQMVHRMMSWWHIKFAGDRGGPSWRKLCPMRVRRQLLPALERLWRVCREPCFANSIARERSTRVCSMLSSATPSQCAHAQGSHAFTMYACAYQTKLPAKAQNLNLDLSDQGWQPTWL